MTAKTKYCIAVLLLFAGRAQARTPGDAFLPDKPQPTAHVRVADREFRIDVALLAASWTFDTITTHEGRKGNPSVHEAGLLFNGSRSTPKVMSAWAAVDVGAVVLSYEWKKHIRNRWLHPLWRVPLLVGAAGHTQTAIGNWRSMQ